MDLNIVFLFSSSTLWKSQKLLSIEQLPLGVGGGGIPDTADDLPMPSLKQRWGGWALPHDQDDADAGSQEAVSISEYFSSLQRRLANLSRRTMVALVALLSAAVLWLLYRRFFSRARVRRSGRKGRARRRILSLPVGKLLRGV